MAKPRFSKSINVYKSLIIFTLSIQHFLKLNLALNELKVSKVLTFRFVA